MDRLDGCGRPWLIPPLCNRFCNHSARRIVLFFFFAPSFLSSSSSSSRCFLPFFLASFGIQDNIEIFRLKSVKFEVGGGVFKRRIVRESRRFWGGVACLCWWFIVMSVSRQWAGTAVCRKACCCRRIWMFYFCCCCCCGGLIFTLYSFRVASSRCLIGSLFFFIFLRVEMIFE